MNQQTRQRIAKANAKRCRLATNAVAVGLGRSECIGGAKVDCAFCHGTGTRLVRWGREVACNCAYRAIFRACLARFRECAMSQHGGPGIKLEYAFQGSCTRRIYGFKGTEFMCDLDLISRRVLDDFSYKVFRHHFVLGADWKACCDVLRIDRGMFFHTIYLIEQRLGRVFAEIRPYPLYPLDEYFGGTVGAQACSAVPLTMCAFPPLPGRSEPSARCAP